jgi:hypothetical protein
VSMGIVAGIDPRAWKIVNGNLYLNLSVSIQELWEKNIPGYIVQADTKWPKLSQGEL